MSRSRTMQRNFGHRPRVSRRDPIDSGMRAANRFVAIAIVGYVAILVTMLMVLV